MSFGLTDVHRGIFECFRHLVTGGRQQFRCILRLGCRALLVNETHLSMRARRQASQSYLLAHLSAWSGMNFFTGSLRFRPPNTRGRRCVRRKQISGRHSLSPGGAHDSEAWTSCEHAYAASLTALGSKWTVVLPCPPRPSQTSARSLLCHLVWSWSSMSLSLDLT
jgi:hypothetical protein